MIGFVLSGKDLELGHAAFPAGLSDRAPFIPPTQDAASEKMWTRSRIPMGIDPAFSN